MESLNHTDFKMFDYKEKNKYELSIRIALLLSIVSVFCCLVSLVLCFCKG